MRKITLFFVPVAISTLTFSGCASYNAASLNNLSAGIVQTSELKDDVFITAKAFTKADCKRYLDRDVIKKGYQPVQLYIQNSSDRNYAFSLSRISLPCATPEEVAEKVHTSTVGRAVGYGAAAWFTCGLFAIPAIVDGVKSAQANESLDNDFSSKAARDQVIFPYSHFNKIIFVPLNEYQSVFVITLIDQGASRAKTFTVIAN